MITRPGVKLTVHLTERLHRIGARGGARLAHCFHALAASNQHPDQRLWRVAAGCGERKCVLHIVYATAHTLWSAVSLGGSFARVSILRAHGGARA